MGLESVGAAIDTLKATHPALYVVLSDMPEFRLTVGCGGCPYAGAAPPTSPDLCEGCAQHEPSGEDDQWFTCKLRAGEHVWGEQPTCTEKDWRRRAREETVALVVGKRLPT